MPNKTVHCSICGQAISGYDFRERMTKLRRHRKLRHPTAHKRSIVKSIKTRLSGKHDPEAWEKTREEELYSPSERRHKEYGRRKHDPEPEMKVRKKLIAVPRVEAFKDYRASQGLVRVLQRANNTLFPELMLALKFRGMAHEIQDDMLKDAGFTEEERGMWVIRSNKFSVFMYV